MGTPDIEQTIVTRLVDALARVIPELVASGLQPMICEYIDRSTMKGLLRANDLARSGFPRRSPR